LFYLSSIPVKVNKDGILIDDLKSIIREGMEFINNFYLEFNNKKDAFPAILNMLMLNYDNFIDANEESKIQLLTKEKAR